MTEQQYKELLSTLGIGNGKSGVDTRELLNAKLNEYLDRTDTDAQQMVSDIQDALDYVEEFIEKMGGGIALASEESDKTEEISQDSFAGRVDGRKGPISYTSSSATGGATTTTGNGAQGTSASLASVRHPWFYSLTGDKNVDMVFALAENDLGQKDFAHAESAFDSILRIEANNAGAYLGKVLAKYNLQNPTDIATCYADGFENNFDLKKAETYGTDKQKKFIQDALEERRKGKIYLDAEKMAANDATLLQAAVIFDSIADYRDAKKKADLCREKIKQLKEEDKKKEKEAEERENNNQKQEEDRKRQEAEEKKRLKKEKRIKVIIFVIACIILAFFIRVLNDTGMLYSMRCTIIEGVGAPRGPSLKNAFYFGEIEFEEDFDGRFNSENIQWYPYITAIKAKDVKGTSYITNCKSLEKITTENMNSDLYIYDCPKLKTVESQKTTKIKISNCQELETVKVIDQFTESVRIENCDSLTKLELPDSFSGSISINGCDSLKDFEMPENVGRVNIYNCEYLEDYEKYN